MSETTIAVDAASLRQLLACARPHLPEYDYAEGSDLSAWIDLAGALDAAELAGTPDDDETARGLAYRCLDTLLTAADRDRLAAHVTAHRPDDPDLARLVGVAVSCAYMVGAEAIAAHLTGPERSDISRRVAETPAPEPSAEAPAGGVGPE